MVALADGADVLLFRTTDAIASYRPARTVASQIANAADLPYGKFLSLAGRRHDRAAAAAGARPHLGVGLGPHRGVEVRVRRLARPLERRAAPAARRVSRVGDAVDDMEPAPMADVAGTIALLTIDRIAYSPSPPIVFAVVDCDGGGRCRSSSSTSTPTTCRSATASR